MNMPPNYGMGGGMPMGGFPVQQGMNPQQQQQQMMQRMQAAQPNANMPTPTQRNFTGQQPSQRTPTPNNGQAPPQPQLAGPQNTSSSQAGPSSGANATQQQAPTQVSSSNSIQTPQTPMFPAPTQGNTANGTSSTTTPLSPGTDPKDKERFSLVLEINNELLAEAINIQNTQQAIKKERAAANGTDGQANDGDKKTTEDELLGQDYFQCMRRLQTNLTYLAAIADKKGQQLPCPAYLKPPTLNTSIKLRGPAAPDGTETKIELPDREETSKFIIDLYKKLQGLYPGVDPNREPTFTMPSGSGRAGAQGPGSTASGTQTPSQASPVPGKQKTPTMANSAPPQTAGISAP
ncbi:hypothetical protein F5Y16DRAFT_354746 [Xylariaceae sp. FL0255]|nr:hypothetical protein F5Y16DRAFT_354746 [Xylariaceae sp. FL0255]